MRNGEFQFFPRCLEVQRDHPRPSFFLSYTRIRRRIKSREGQQKKKKEKVEAKRLDGTKQNEDCCEMVEKMACKEGSFDSLLVVVKERREPVVRRHLTVLQISSSLFPSIRFSVLLVLSSTAGIYLLHLRLTDKTFYFLSFIPLPTCASRTSPAPTLESLA